MQLTEDQVERAISQERSAGTRDEARREAVFMDSRSGNVTFTAPRCAAHISLAIVRWGNDVSEALALLW